MSEDLALTVSPEILLSEFMPLLAIDEERSFSQLARGMGSKDISRPRRVIERFLTATDIFGLATVSETGVILTARGLRFRGSASASRASIRSAFYSSEIPKLVAKLLSTSQTLTREEAGKRLAVANKEAELDHWLEWLEYGAFISVVDDRIVMRLSSNRPIDLYLPEEMKTLQEERYRHLASMEYANVASISSESYRTVMELVKEFRNQVPDKAEGTMRRLVRCVFASLGIAVQVENGPRETRPDARSVRVQFGAQGDDAVGFFLRPPIVLAESSAGLVLAMELKRTASDKKAVGQAVTAAGQWRAHFEERAIVFPITLSDSETYSERTAREYATTNGVVHLPVDSLVQLASLQKERFLSDAVLVTPVHIWTILEALVQTAYVEPTTEDFIGAVTEILQ